MSYEYFKYADKIMKNHEKYEEYKIKLNKYKFYDVLEEDNIIFIISKIVIKIVKKTENINKTIIEQRYLKYIENFTSNIITIDKYNYNNYITCKLNNLTHCYKCKNNTNIPYNIKIYCLCLGIKINKYIIV